ncbi:hypothetical protein PIB30_036197 [Stylosanthes scabra]|uniref:Uncharacterized protein n=1 Tax=Stylosanthes scabra TaxID=79078 RepID=A0ABU6SE06_9FABA|nr:hypothetical protein [Stylosanthes scabra]
MKLFDDVNLVPNNEQRNECHDVNEQEHQENQSVGKTSSQQLARYVSDKQQIPLFPSSAPSSEILRNYENKFRRLRGKRLCSSETNSIGQQKISTEEIMRVAGATYIQYSSQWQNGFIISMHPYESSFMCLPDKGKKDVELAQFLFAAAERVGCQQFERARSLLLHCQSNSSSLGSSVQRVVFHFSQALRERLIKQIGGGVTTTALSRNMTRDRIEEFRRDYKSSLTCHQKLPFNQVAQFISVQTIVEHTASKIKIHLIDLSLGYGLMATVLMQALVERKEKPVELLKITAVGYGGRRGVLDEARRRLVSFAESLNLPFSFMIVIVEDIKEISEELFEIEDDEVVAVYAPNYLKNLMGSLDSLDHLMRVIRKIKPAIMVVVEVEASLNSTSFVNRFIESLFFYSALFDSTETCLSQNDESRMRLESVLSEGIRDLIVFDDTERTVRNVKIEVWRRFFARFKMVEIGFSKSSVYQGNMILRKFGCSNICTIVKNEKCLVIEWKGTPVHSISAWKFH